MEQGLSRVDNTSYVSEVLVCFNLGICVSQKRDKEMKFCNHRDCSC